MKSTVVDESLSSFKPMYCSREYQASTRLIQQYEKSTLNYNKKYYQKLEQRLKYLQKVLLDFKMRQLALLNKDREYFQYNSGDLVYLTSPMTSQLRTASRKIMVKYVGPLVVYKIVDPHNYLLMTLDGKLLRGLFEHERIKPAVIRMSEGNVTNLAHLKQIVSIGMLV